MAPAKTKRRCVNIASVWSFCPTHETDCYSLTHTSTTPTQIRARFSRAKRGWRENRIKLNQIARCASPRGQTTFLMIEIVNSSFLLAEVSALMGLNTRLPSSRKIAGHLKQAQAGQA